MVKVVEKVKVLVEGGRRPSGTIALFSYLFCFWEDPTTVEFKVFFIKTENR